MDGSKSVQNLIILQIQNFKNMENQLQSKASITSTVNPLVTFSLQPNTTIIKNIQNLIYQQAKLELGLASDIDLRLRSSYDEAKIQLKLELRRAELAKCNRALDEQQKSQTEERVKLILQKMRKLKEISIYFRDLKKQGGSLQADVQKFMFYIPKSSDFQSRILSFLSQPIVSQLILKQHEKNFNNNNFLAEIIDFYHFLGQNRLLTFPKDQLNQRFRNQDLVFIQNNNLIFRHICQINDKYSLIEQQLEKAYVHLDFLRTENQEEALIHKKYKQEAENIRLKLKQLNTIAKKIRGNPTFSYEEIVVIPEEADIFESMTSTFEYSLKDRNQHFFGFLQEIYEGKPADLPKTNTGKFLFLRKKIIKAEMCWNLNRLISAFNIGSYCVNQLHDGITVNPKIYKFTHPSELIKYEINEKRVSFYSQREPDLYQLQVFTKNLVVLNIEEGHILRREKGKIIYPSAIYNYYHLLKYLLALSTILANKNIYNQELLLEIIKIKANEYNQWAQTALTLYQIVKNKYFTAYKPLQDYIRLVFNSKWAQELQSIQRLMIDQNTSQQKILVYFNGKEQKASWINQIIFQLDSSEDITEPLANLLQIELQHNLTGYCSDYPHFYELILNEIIQTRNNLKFDRCYSLISLHQLFAFPTTHADSLQVLAKELAPLCRDRLKLSQLLRFQACQGDLKRKVFKAELYWTNILQPSVKNKFIFVSQRKKISFKDFLEQNAKYLLSILDQNLSFFITNIEEVERAVILFGQEVQRLKLIQSSLILLKPNFALEDHLSAFNHKQLMGFFSYCSNFNFIEDIYIRREKKHWVINQISKLITASKLRFGDLNMEMWTVTLKQILGGFVFFIYALEHHLTRDDCVKIKSKVIGNQQPPQYHLKLQILRSKREAVKEYQDSQFLQGTALAQFVQIYQLLIHITLNEILRKNDIPNQEKAYLQKIRASLPSNEPFRLVEQLIAQENIKRMTDSSNKSHTLASLRSILTDFKQKKETFRGYSKPWRTMQYLFMLPQIGIVTRRILCNQLIMLKNKVSGQEWKSFNKQNCLGKLKQMLEVQLIEEINRFLSKDLGVSEQINPQYNLNQNCNLLSQYTKKYILQQQNQRYSFEEVQKRPIVLFDQYRGIQIDYKQEIAQYAKKKYIKKGRANQKRGLLNTVTNEDAKTAILVNNLQQKVNFQIVKQSLKMRKAIYKLQLQQKRIQDQIGWQTCKLQHNVVKKINCFIEQSNLDQKQSLINFKYTVNLETIKGIENVIHQRTQIFGKKAFQNSNSELSLNTHQEPASGFVTEPRQKQALQSQQSLLDLNVRNIFNHVKKIKIFWAWKNMYMSKQSGEDEWKQFSVNVERILHNRQNMTKLNQLEVERENCGKNEIVCNLIKEESNLLNNIVKNTKINHLTSKLSQFKAKHALGEQNQQII